MAQKGIPYGMVMELPDQKLDHDEALFRFAPAFHKQLRARMDELGFREYNPVIVDFFEDKGKSLMTVYTRIF